jgi:predicted nucleic acid-binding Zn ribbon protein
MKKLASPEKVGSIVKSLLAERGYLTICEEQAVCERWAELVGERIARVARCTKVERGVVHVQVESATWRHELAYLKATLLDRIRRQCNSIKELVLY